MKLVPLRVRADTITRRVTSLQPMWCLARGVMFLPEAGCFPNWKNSLETAHRNDIISWEQILLTGALPLLGSESISKERGRDTRKPWRLFTAWRA